MKLKIMIIAGIFMPLSLLGMIMKQKRDIHTKIGNRYCSKYANIIDDLILKEKQPAIKLKDKAKSVAPLSIEPRTVKMPKLGIVEISSKPKLKKLYESDKHDQDIWIKRFLGLSPRAN